MKKLHEALLKAQQKIEALRKDDRNEFAKFDYVSAENVVKNARATLHGEGLLFFPSNEEIQTAVDGVIVFKRTYTIAHIPSGEETEITCTGVFEAEKGKSLSQSQGSAETYMLKNVLREMLLIPRFAKGEDLDGSDNSSRPGRTAGNPSYKRR